MKISYPLTYQVAELPVYNINTLRALLSIRVVERSLKSLPAGALLVKMEAAPCNPSDIAFMQGGYNVIKTLPAVPGFEGCGIVVDTGKDVDASKWIGKQVSCFAQGDSDGTWAEYMLASPEQLLPAHDQFTPEQAAVFFVNPFTAYGLIQAARNHNSKTILVNAAGSRVSEYLLALSKMYGIDVVAIVRRKQTAEMLSGKGFKAVIVSSEPTFEEEITAALQTYQPTTFFDAVAGEQTGIIAKNLPENSQIIVYGGLSGKDISGINALQLIFKKLTIMGFDLNVWFARNNPQTLKEASELLTKLILSQEVLNPVGIQVSLNELVKGLRHYLGAMSEGKMLIRF